MGDLLTKEERKQIRDDWFKSVPRSDGKLPIDLYLEAQQAKDIPDREKIAEYLYAVFSEPFTGVRWDGVPEDGRDCYRLNADQIIALIKGQ